MASDLRNEAARLLELANRIDLLIACYSNALQACDLQRLARVREQAAALQREYFPEVQTRAGETEPQKGRRDAPRPTPSG
jgi:hypothetical protein